MTDQAEERALESIGNERSNQALTPTLVRPDFDCPVQHCAAGTDSTLVVDREGTLMVWGLAAKRAKLSSINRTLGG